MADIDVWRGYAKEHTGNVVVWINQSDPHSTVVEGNSRGVCYAITIDWISSYRKKYLSDRSYFVNSFRQYDDKGQLLKHSIPKRYLDNQDKLKKKRDADAKSYKDLYAEYETAKAAYDKSKTKGAKDKMDKAKKIALDFDRVASGGPECLGFRRAKTIDAAIQMLSGVAAPGYYALSMSTKGGGHIVGFEFRSDQTAPSFSKPDAPGSPGIYEFIDANYGLFVFGRAADMMAFYTAKVWPQYQKYTVFKLLQYDIGLGGFGSLEQEFEDMEAELIEEMEKEMEKEYGKEWWKK